MIAVIFAKRSIRLPAKHHIMICGEEMIDRVSRILYESKIFDRIILYTKDETINSRYCEVVIDHSNGILINSVIECLKIYSEFLAIGGDMPLIDYDLLKIIIDAYDKRPVSLSSYGIIQPLLSLYNNLILNSLNSYIMSGGTSLYKFILNNDFKIINVNTFKTMSVNTSIDLIKIKRYLGC